MTSRFWIAHALAGGTLLLGDWLYASGSALCGGETLSPVDLVVLVGHCAAFTWTIVLFVVAPIASLRSIEAWLLVGYWIALAHWLDSELWASDRALYGLAVASLAYCSLRATWFVALRRWAERGSR